MKTRASVSQLEAAVMRAPNDRALQLNLSAMRKMADQSEEQLKEFSSRAYIEKVEAAKMARKRLEDFADQAQAGRVHYDARELKRKVWAAFAEFDSLERIDGQ